MNDVGIFKDEFDIVNMTTDVKSSSSSDAKLELDNILEDIANSEGSNMSQTCPCGKAFSIWYQKHLGPKSFGTKIIWYQTHLVPKSFREKMFGTKIIIQLGLSPRQKNKTSVMDQSRTLKSPANHPQPPTTKNF